eukprot:TRINITY_DN32933_c0_g1_i1.p1 TRINITY_DN32933_c0_g1~~TRINITY_DN32933_c0_g1_i1.p1  ORF type:complete len:276 (+),score=33.68 TRINITY_DN32933_c0_g1_i1:77-829(+)
MSGGAVDLSGGGGGGGGGPSVGGVSLAGPSSASTGGGASSSSGHGGGFAASAMSHPVVQDQMQAMAYDQAQQGMQAAKTGAILAAQEIGKYIQEGPAGISILCFLGGIVTTVVGFFGLLDIVDGLVSPFHYVLHIYLTGFGAIAVMLEADTQSLARMKVIGRLGPLFESWQVAVFKRAQFLTELRGRGLFYVFVGTLAISQCMVCLLFLVGLWNVLMGVICVLMSFGINPVDHIPQNEQAHPLNNPAYSA